MIRTRSSQRRKSPEIRTSDKFQNPVRIGKMTNHPVFRRTQTPQYRNQPAGSGFSYLRIQRFYFLTAENLPILLYSRLNILRSFFDYLETIDIAIIGGICPRKQSMTSQNQPFHPRMSSYIFLHFHTQIKSRPLPGQPSNLTAP